MNDPEDVIADALTELPESISAPDPQAIHRIAAKRAVVRTRTLRAGFAIALIAVIGVAAFVFQADGPAEVATAPPTTTSAITAAPSTASTTTMQPFGTTTLGDRGRTETPTTLVPLDSLEPLEPAIPPTASDQPPDSILVIQEGVAILEVRNGVEREIATFPGAPPSAEGGPRFVESILPLDANLAMVGMCCEPAVGNQGLLNLQTGEFESLNFFASFPSTDPTADTIAATDVAVNAHISYPLLRSLPEDPLQSPFLFSSEGTILHRTEFVGHERIVVTDGEQLVSLVAWDGQTISQAAIPGVRTLAFDERNSMLLALAESDGVIDSQSIAADTLVILHPETLAVLEEQPLSPPVVEFDVRDGWVVLAHPDGTVTVQDINGAQVQEPLLVGATAVEWAVPEELLVHPILGDTDPAPSPQTTIPADG